MKQKIPNMLDISINLDHSHLWGPLYPTNNINRVVLQESGNFTWRGSDFEELGKVNLRRRWVVLRVFISLILLVLTCTVTKG